jgi:DNA-binding transcriptional regulator YiaG
VRAPEEQVTEASAQSAELGPEFGRLLRLIEATAPRRTHIARLLLPEFTGRELARIRISLDLSIEEVAYLASITVWQLKHMEEGCSNPRYRPSLEVLESVRAALHFHIMRRLKRREGVAPDRRKRT